MECSGTTGTILVPEMFVIQGVVHACHHDGFHDLGTFDEAPGTVQSPGVRADAQCCKIMSRSVFISLIGWSLLWAGMMPLPPGLATLRVSFRRRFQNLFLVRVLQLMGGELGLL